MSKKTWSDTFTRKSTNLPQKNPSWISTKYSSYYKISFFSFSRIKKITTNYSHFDIFDTSRASTHLHRRCYKSYSNQLQKARRKIIKDLENWIQKKKGYRFHRCSILKEENFLKAYSSYENVKGKARPRTKGKNTQKKRRLGQVRHSTTPADTVHLRVDELEKTLEIFRLRRVKIHKTDAIFARHFVEILTT